MEPSTMEKLQNPCDEVGNNFSEQSDKDEFESENSAMREEETEDVKHTWKENDDEEVVESILPVHTLPEEIGLKIFEILDDRDVSSCFKTFPNWDQWLKPQRTRFLFPEVAPFVIEWLPKSAFLECRNVCRTWKEGLDNACILHPKRLQIHLQASRRTPELVNEFARANDIQHFLNEMEFHTGNPFLARTVSINWIVFETRQGLLYAEQTINFWNNVNRLLDRFGQHVLFFKIHIRDAEWIWFREHLLLDCLERLPNLRRLEIYAEHLFNSDQIQVYYSHNPLPQLLHLQTLVLHAPYHLINVVLNSCCVPHNIKQLEICDNNKENENEFDVSEFGDDEGIYLFYEAVYNFKNLEALYVVKRMRIEEFEQLMIIPPPLKSLHLYIHNREDFIVDFERFFATLELLTDSLEVVEVQSMPYDTVFRMERNDFKINLPKLKRLTLIGYEGPLDTFLQLKSINHLEISFSETLRPWNHSEAQLYGFKNRMENSNIWALLPTLKTLVIRGNDWRGNFRSLYKRNHAGRITGRFSGKREGGVDDATLSLIEYENPTESEHENGKDESESDEESGRSFWCFCMLCILCILCICTTWFRSYCYH